METFILDDEYFMRAALTEAKKAFESDEVPVGAVIVSTPQDLALMDAVRAISLFDQGKVPVIGVVENMAGYACPHCGEVSDPFGSGGAEAAAPELERLKFAAADARRRGARLQVLACLAHVLPRLLPGGEGDRFPVGLRAFLHHHRVGATCLAHPQEVFRL